MLTDLLIQVCVETGSTNTETGSILENFSSRFLRSQGYDVIQQIRLTGMEVDLLCKNRITGENILVECKAYRNNIPADVISKLLGNVELRECSSGWLISTYDLSKDAKGIEYEWGLKTEEKRKKLRIYSPTPLILSIISANIVVDPNSCAITEIGLRESGEAFLLLTQRGNFWAVLLIDNETGLTTTVALFDAATGNPIRSKELVSWISQTNTSLRALTWISEESAVSKPEKLYQELQSIVSVPMAEHWADYRPSRPIDFVGRETIQKDIFHFLDTVREKTTSTRLIALKSPSGWGKSSSILKIVDRARSTRNRSRYFVHAVDSRAALTKLFPELAFASAVKSAISQGFIKNISNLTFGSTGNILSTEAMKELTKALSEQNKVICVFFDQFEELLYKEDLVEVFDEMRRLCTAVEEAQENIVIGFSWKTDGTITTEHRAYHLWHELSEHRFELDLPPFSEREVSQAILRFGKELGQPLALQLKRLLEDHCQGFPWLLKKLCVHILEMVRSGSDQSDILERNLNIISLFKRDIERLSADEYSCTKHIAKESPAEYFKISQIHGDHTVNSLVNKRLIIRSGPRLTIYWDIFRDYILTEKIPYIPVTYTPQAQCTVYLRALSYLSGGEQVTYGALSEAMELSEASTDNLVRDLVSVGHVEASRREGILRPLFEDDESALDIVFSFWKSHEVVRRIEREIGLSVNFDEEEFLRIFSSIHRVNYTQKTLTSYSKRNLRWLINMGLIHRAFRQFILVNPTIRPEMSLRELGSFVGRGGIFLAEAPPKSVVSAHERLLEGDCARSIIEDRFGRNSVVALLNLNLIRLKGQQIQLLELNENSLMAVRDAALSTKTVQLTIEILLNNPLAKGKLIGELLSTQLNIKWAVGSQKRYGTALRQWAQWVEVAEDKSRGDLFTEKVDVA